MSKKIIRRKDQMTEIERDLVEGLSGFLEHLKSDEPIEKKFTCRRVVLDLEPRTYSAEQVKATRKILNASQLLFAQFLGVSVKTVCGWERGKPVNDMACRFMDEIHQDPEHWRKRLYSMIRVKTC